MIEDKKGVIPAVEMLAIIIVFVVCLVWWAVIILQSQDIFLDERKVNTQIVVDRFLDGRCFSEEYGVFDRNMLVSENFDRCFVGGESKFLVRILLDGQEFFVGSEDEFRVKANLCGYRGNILCSELKYPVRVGVGDGNFEDDLLVLQIVAY